MMRALSKFGVLDVGAEKRLAQKFVKQLAIRTPSVDQKVMFLSGGNQQRVVVAKWIATQPKLLIVDEPTRGIDVGAKAEIHGLLADLAGQGMALLMISSELPEIIAVSDRVLVMHQGRIAGELAGRTVTQESIMHLRDRPARTSCLDGGISQMLSWTLNPAARCREFPARQVTQ